jgi:hypothetical protein
MNIIFNKYETKLRNYSMVSFYSKIYNYSLCFGFGGEFTVVITNYDMKNHLGVIGIPFHTVLVFFYELPKPN